MNTEKIEHSDGLKSREPSEQNRRLRPRIGSQYDDDEGDAVRGRRALSKAFCAQSMHPKDVPLAARQRLTLARPCVRVQRVCGWRPRPDGLAGERRRDGDGGH